MRVGVVVPCTESKRPGTSCVRLADFPRHASAPRVHRWLAALRAAEPRVPAHDLYKGVGWSASRDLVAAVSGQADHTEVRIISAGHGAIRPEEPISNYSATFVPGHPDSIAAPTSVDPHLENQAWWAGVNLDRGSATPLADLAGSVDGLLVAASTGYIDALGDDLAEATKRVATVVYCAGRPQHPAVADVAPVFDRRLREGDDPFVRANDQSLNQRVAAAVVEHLAHRAWDYGAANALLAQEMERPPPIRHDRRPSSDDTVARFIADQLRRDPSATKSNLLRRWRDGGRACEQRRFSRIYHEARRSMRPDQDQELARDDDR